MENVIIRPATEADLSALLELYLEFHNFHARRLPSYLHTLDVPNGPERDMMLSNIYKAVLANDANILVAESSGKLIGLAEVYLKQTGPESTGSVPINYGHLQSLAVTEKYRQRNIGSKLLRAAEAWAEQHGVDEMRLDIWEFPAGPLGFYNKQGYQTLKRTLSKSLKTA